jgi:hypothetical protein
VTSYVGNFFVGDEVTSLKLLWFLKDELETPYVVSYFFNRRLAPLRLGVLAVKRLPPSLKLRRGKED